MSCPYSEWSIDRFLPRGNQLASCIRTCHSVIIHVDCQFWGLHGLIASPVVPVFLLGSGSKSAVEIHLWFFWRVLKVLRPSQLDASDKCSFAEWACWSSVTFAFFHSSRFEDKGPTSLAEKVPQAYYCQESSPSWFWANLRRSGDRGRRVPYSSGTSTTTAKSAFALWCHGDSAVVTWGNFGGDCSEVRDQLKGVQQIEATHYAFAAILEDGSVVTWGHAQHGGDSSAVQDQLEGVQKIQATDRAFAAILADGCVVTWGDSGYGGDSSAVQDQLKGVLQIQAASSPRGPIGEVANRQTWRRVLRRSNSRRLTRWPWSLRDSQLGCEARALAVGGDQKGSRIICSETQKKMQILQANLLCCCNSGWCKQRAEVLIVRFQTKWHFGPRSGMVAFHSCEWPAFEPRDSRRFVLRKAIEWRCSAPNCAFWVWDGCDKCLWQSGHRHRWGAQPWWRFWSSKCWQHTNPTHPHPHHHLPTHTHSLCLCCDSGRWIRRYLGWCRPWRWQLGSSRSAQVCLV